MAWELGDVHRCGGSYIRVIERDGDNVKVRFCNADGVLGGEHVYGPYDIRFALGDWVFHLSTGHRPFQVGDVVLLNPDSIWALHGPTLANPVGVEGTITIINQDNRAGLPVNVEWGNGRFNNYNPADLILVKAIGGAPVPAPKVAEKPAKVVKPSALKAAIKTCFKGTGTANYHFVHDDNTQNRSANTACHAEVAYHYTRISKDKTPKWVVSSINRGIDYKEFYKWLIDESVWSVCFRYRAAWSLKNRCVVCYTDVEANLLQTALVATRIPWEHEGFADKFQEMLGLGIEGHIAFRLAIGMNPTKGKFRVGGGEGYGHFPIESMPWAQQLSNFRKGKFLGIGPYNKVKKYETTGRLWDSNVDNKPAVAIKELAFKHIGSSGTGWQKDVKIADAKEIVAFAKMLEEIT